MAYEAKVWVGGEPVTAAYLNRIEQGLAEVSNASSDAEQTAFTTFGISVETVDEVHDTYTMSASVADILRALETGCVLFRIEAETYRVWSTGVAVYLDAEGVYSFCLTIPPAGMTPIVFTASDMNDHPAVTVEKSSGEEPGGDEPIDGGDDGVIDDGGDGPIDDGGGDDTSGEDTGGDGTGGDDTAGDETGGDVSEEPVEEDLGA